MRSISSTLASATAQASALARISTASSARRFGESFFESCALLESLAGAILIRPEAGITDESLQFIELTLAGTCVKETSGRLPLGS